VTAARTEAAIEPCPRCGKPPAICVCDRIEPMTSRTKVVVLQHPREEDAALGTAKLVTLSLPASASLVVGLSWPSLEGALEGVSGLGTIDRAKWGVVFAQKLPEPLPPEVANRQAIVVDRHGKVLLQPRLDGILVLDGTWSQAKALWWRNAWLLKLARVVLRPSEPTIYGRMRKAPRREWVSTLEATADALVALGEPEATRAALRGLMRTMVQRARDAGIR
jgi:DTW domain-containing protein